MLAWAWRDFHEDSLGSVYVCERPAARVEARPGRLGSFINIINGISNDEDGEVVTKFPSCVPGGLLAWTPGSCLGRKHSSAAHSQILVLNYPSEGPEFKGSPWGLGGRGGRKSEAPSLVPD